MHAYIQGLLSISTIFVALQLELKNTISLNFKIYKRNKLQNKLVSKREIKH